MRRWRQVIGMAAAGLTLWIPLAAHAEGIHGFDRRSESEEIFWADQQARQAVGGGRVTTVAAGHLAGRAVWLITVVNPHGTHQVAVSQGNYRVVKIRNRFTAGRDS
ncbi:MAG: hypothetical protein M0Z53_08135 [Thermaerobacter sp.]|nr:hypothetical protein [Thermaerobacter sp.]